MDWSLLGREDPKYHDLFATLEDRKSVVAWNEQEKSALSQVGGVATTEDDTNINLSAWAQQKRY